MGVRVNRRIICGRGEWVVIVESGGVGGSGTKAETMLEMRPVLLAASTARMAKNQRRLAKGRLASETRVRCSERREARQRGRRLLGARCASGAVDGDGGRVEPLGVSLSVHLQLVVRSCALVSSRRGPGLLHAADSQVRHAGRRKVLHSFRHAQDHGTGADLEVLINTKKIIYFLPLLGVQPVQGVFLRIVGDRSKSTVTGPLLENFGSGSWCVDSSSFMTQSWSRSPTPQ